MSGFFDDDPEPATPRAVLPPGPSGRARALAITAFVLVLAFFLLSSFTGIWTDKLWFHSVGYGSVFSTILRTKVLLFLLFGVLFGAAIFVNIFLAYRFRPLFRPSSTEQDNLDRYREVVQPLRRWLAIGVSVIIGLFAGGSATGEWRNFLLWRHSQSFGQKDPYFHKDLGFFVFSLPWWHYVVNVLMTVSVISLLAAALVHYLFGGIRLQAKGEKLTGAAQAQFSALLGLFVLFKAVDYWLDRFDLSTDQGRFFTGVNYTADHAQLPAKNILMYIAVICAVLFFANIFRRTWMLPSLALGLLVVSAILLGALWPGIVWQFQVKPSEGDKEAAFLQRNITATRQAYAVDDSASQVYDATVDVTKDDLASETDALPGVRLIDPARVSQAFEQLQQIRGYYSVSNVLDIDRYDVNGQSRDVVLGVREVDQSGLATNARNWNNEHTVYTHGYGIIAAYGNNRTADNGPVPKDQSDQPAWAEQGLPPRGVLSELGYEPRIYFGERSPEYSIVGKLAGGTDVENDSNGGLTTYDGQDGVGIGGFFHKMLYALKFGDSNIVLSSRVDKDSRILYERQPKERVAKIAPWLTLDQDPYPAVVDGKVLWILDGYTTSDRYPNSERKSFKDMTSDALAKDTTYVTLPTDQINYLRNSVKITVDAYDGTVNLYEWQADPILKAWEKVFPGVVQPKSKISDTLLQHLRYPEDLFKAQREILAKYHVTDPQVFYKGSDQWDVPQDPSDAADKQPPYRLSVQMPPDEKDPSSPTSPMYSLTSVYVPTNKNNLAAYIAVDSDAATPDYGKIRMLTLGNSQVQGPQTIANQFATDDHIKRRLLFISQNGSSVVYGNLLTLPVGGGLLYVQPVYAQRNETAAQGAYPVLRYVLASFGNQAGIGKTLNAAVNDVLGVTGGGGGTSNPPPTKNNGGSGKPSVPQSVLQLLTRIENKQAAADRALRAGDLQTYAQIQDQIKTLTERALVAATAANQKKSP